MTPGPQNREALADLLPMWAAKPQIITNCDSEGSRGRDPNWNFAARKKWCCVGLVDGRFRRSLFAWLLQYFLGSASSVCIWLILLALPFFSVIHLSDPLCGLLHFVYAIFLKSMASSFEYHREICYTASFCFSNLTIPWLLRFAAIDRSV